MDSVLGWCYAKTYFWGILHHLEVTFVLAYQQYFKRTVEICLDVRLCSLSPMKHIVYILLPLVQMVLTSRNYYLGDGLYLTLTWVCSMRKAQEASAPPSPTLAPKYFIGILAMQAS